jgi:hypothetical protein
MASLAPAHLVVGDVASTGKISGDVVASTEPTTRRPESDTAMHVTSESCLSTGPRTSTHAVGYWNHTARKEDVASVHGYTGTL